MGTDQLTFTGSLVVRSCWCGIRFGVPGSLAGQYDDRRVDSLYCPLGHGMVPKRGHSKADLLRAAEARERHLEDQLDAAERSKRALRGHLTRLRNRLINGVCPWCNRNFAQVRRHVASQHPEHVKRMDDALEEGNAHA